jgi:translation initiation factor 4A
MANASTTNTFIASESTNMNTNTDSTPKKMTFSCWDDEEVGLNVNLLRGIYMYGFEVPSEIQKKSIIPMTTGRDIIAQAQSGTGKTGSFTVGSLQRIDCDKKITQVLILAPTRELADQTYQICSQMSIKMDIRVKLLIGGTSTDEDIKDLKEDVPHLVVGTPGRVKDMLTRNALNSTTIRSIVLDEADEMLSAGFKDQVYNILQFMPSDVQVALFSATLPAEVLELTEKFMRDPYKILVESRELTVEGIRQYYVALEDDIQKYNTLKDIFKRLSVAQSIIYCNSVKRVQDLTEAMKQDGFPVVGIHSSMTDDERRKCINDFRRGIHRVLISSNLTARGIDVQQVSIVINFDITKCKHTYLHRIGRSGRWGRKGLAINFITRRDIKHMKEIEQHYSTNISELPEDFDKHLV